MAGRGTRSGWGIRATIALTIAAAALAACGGGKATVAAPTASATISTSTSTASSAEDCWSQIAAQYDAAGDKAFSLIGDEVISIYEDYHALANAVVAHDDVEAKAAYKRLTSGLHSTARNAETFLAEKAAADRVQCARVMSSEAAECWRRAVGWQRSATTEGAKILKAHLQDILDIIGEALDASVARDRDRVRAAVRDMKALFNQLAEEAGPYAQRAGAADASFRQCSA